MLAGSLRHSRAARNDHGRPARHADPEPQRDEDGCQHHYKDREQEARIAWHRLSAIIDLPSGGARKATTSSRAYERPHS